VNITRFYVFTYNLMFYIRLGTREWMDGRGWVWMTFLDTSRYLILDNSHYICVLVGESDEFHKINLLFPQGGVPPWVCDQIQ
jgi:hypothetical protein